MPQVDPAMRVQLYAVAAAHVSPKDNKRHMEEALEQYKEESDEQIRLDLEQGMLTWAKLKPAQQWQAFKENTLTQDIPLLLDEVYMDARSQGLVPPLLVEELWQDWTTEQQQLAQLAEYNSMLPPEAQIPVPQASKPPPMFWPLILQVRPWVGQYWAAQFRKLYRQHIEEGI